MSLLIYSQRDWAHIGKGTSPISVWKYVLPPLLSKYFSRLSPPLSPRSHCPLQPPSLFFFGHYGNSLLFGLSRSSLALFTLACPTRGRLISLKYEYGYCHFCAKVPITFKLEAKFLSPGHQPLCDFIPSASLALLPNLSTSLFMLPLY